MMLIEFVKDMHDWLPKWLFWFLVGMVITSLTLFVIQTARMVSV